MGEIINFQQPAEGAVAEDPKLDEGYTRIVNELIEALAQANLASRHFRTMFAIIRQTYGWHKTKDRISSGQLANLTGMSRQNAHKAMRDLLAMNLIHRIDGTTIRINTRTGTWNMSARPRQNRQGAPGTVNDGDDSNTSPQSVTDGDDSGVNDGDDKTVNDGDDHKRKERKGKKESGGQTPPSADADSRADESASQDEPTETPRRDPVPYQAIVDAYHEILPELPQVQKLTDNRRRAIRARWNDTYGARGRPGNSLDFWRRYFWHVKHSRFLCGLKDDTDRPWRANLDFLFRESAMVKIIEGQYHQGDDYRDLPGDDGQEGGDDA